MTESSVLTPRMSHNTRAKKARNTPETSERTAAACTFSASTPRLRSNLNRPVWMEVESLLPIAPKMAPRIPMAGDQDREPDELVEGARDACEHDAGDELPCRGEKQRREPLPEGLFLLREVAVDLRSQAGPVAQPLAHLASAGPGSLRLCLGHGSGIAVAKDDVKCGRLEHPLAAEVIQHSPANQRAQREDGVETEVPLRLRHKDEVHAVDPRDERQRQEDEGDRREPLHALVYALGLLGGVDVKGASKIVAHGVDHVYDPEKVVAHVVVVRPALLWYEPGRRPHQHADDVSQGHGQAPEGGQLVLEVEQGIEYRIRGAFTLAQEVV